VTGPELPILGGEPRERADAARNRRRILAAAARLFERDGVHCTSMDAIAAEAGVGKGTLFRRFGDRASLVRTLLGERDTRFQEAFIRGEPPLGPGAPPAARLVAFGEAMLDLLEEQVDLYLAAEGGIPGAHMRTQAWAVYNLHIRTLVEAGAPELDAELVADALLFSLTAQLFVHQRRVRGMPLDRLKENWAALVQRLLE
jgi:AcrR family transcriptional regulator